MGKLHGLAVLALVVGGACGDDHERQCDSSAECLQGGVSGTCLPSPSSEKHFCAYPDPACASGNRWGVLAGDGLATMCVAEGGADASVDAPADAAPDAPVDAGADATPADAAIDPQLTVAAAGVHTCILRTSTGQVKCWGKNSSGELGLGNVTTIGDDELPSSVAYIDVGSGVGDIEAGDSHTCALLSMGRVRCWGQAVGGALGYGNTNNIGDDEKPVSAGNVDVGGPVKALALGTAFTCALLESGAVRCWGQNSYGQLGYGHTNSIGDNETPASAGDVAVGGVVKQIVAGNRHVCALLEAGTVRCWGYGGNGALGYGNESNVGNDEAPATAGDVDIGGTAVKLAAGYHHTCALMSDGTVRCWGKNVGGQCGYGAEGFDIGDGETPASMGNVDVGSGVIVDIAAGGDSTCVLLQGGAVRCWGLGAGGKLGYGNVEDIGDNEIPATAGDVAVGGSVQRFSVGVGHVCVVLTTGALKCWGNGPFGRLGYGNTNNIGDNESPSSVGPVPF